MVKEANNLLKENISLLIDFYTELKGGNGNESKKINR